MIELNLLPEEQRKKKRKIELPEIPLVPAALGLVGALVIIQVFLVALIVISNIRLSALDKTWEALAPKKVEFDKIKVKTSNLSKKAQAIESLIKNRLNWAPLLNEISNSLTPNVWLTELAYSEKIESRQAKSAGGPANRKKKKKMAKVANVKVQTLTLSGFASVKGGKATDYITRFVTSLRKNKALSVYFSEIDHGPIRKAAVSGQEVMSFTVICSFKPEEVAG